MLGPQDDRFTPKGIAALFEAPYEMLPQIGPHGRAAAGPRIEHARGHDIISDGIALGGIQVIGDGQPIVLLVDRQSTGGYTKIGTICSFDIGRIGQVKPGPAAPLPPRDGGRGACDAAAEPRRAGHRDRIAPDPGRNAMTLERAITRLPGQDRPAPASSSRKRCA